MATTKTASAGIVIDAPNIRRVKVEVVGVSPLLTNKITAEAVEALTATGPKGRKVKVHEPGSDRWKKALHVIDEEEGRYGVPAAAFQSALIAAGRFSGVAMTQIRGLVRVDHGILEVTGTAPEMHFALGKPLPTAPVMPIFRAAFPPGWQVVVPISFDESLISLESVLGLVRRAGAHIGVGSFRPERGGPYGVFDARGAEVQ